MTADGRCDQVGRVTPCAPQRFAMVRGHSVFQNPHGAHGVTRPTFRPRLCASERTTPLVRIGELPPLLGERVEMRGNSAFGIATTEPNIFCFSAAREALRSMRLELGFWNFFGAWDLGFGTFPPVLGFWDLELFSQCLELLILAFS